MKTFTLWDMGPLKACESKRLLDELAHCKNPVPFIIMPATNHPYRIRAFYPILPDSVTPWLAVPSLLIFIARAKKKNATLIMDIVLSFETQVRSDLHSLQKDRSNMLSLWQKTLMRFHGVPVKKASKACKHTNKKMITSQVCIMTRVFLIYACFNNVQ